MELEDYTHYLGYILIAILLFLIIRTVINKGKTQEGFLGFGDSSDSSDSSDSKNNNNNNNDSDDPIVTKIQSTIDKLTDTTSKTIKKMNLVKYRSHWEDLIVAMEDRINSLSLQSTNVLANKMNSNPNDKSIVQIIEKLNTLNKYRETLKENMKYLDGLK